MRHKPYGGPPVLLLVPFLLPVAMVWGMVKLMLKGANLLEDLTETKRRKK